MTVLLGLLGVVLAIFLLTVLFGAPYVPSQKRDLRVGFDELYSINPEDTLVDIGSGDGVVLREASRRGARAIGYEINPILVAISRFLSRHDKRVTIKRANYLKSDLPADTTIVYLFGESYHIKQIDDWLSAQSELLGKPIYVMSYGFALPDRQAMRGLRAHRLYLVDSLQSAKAQV